MRVSERDDTSGHDEQAQHDALRHPLVFRVVAAYARTRQCLWHPLSPTCLQGRSCICTHAIVFVASRASASRMGVRLQRTRRAGSLMANLPLIHASGCDQTDGDKTGMRLIACLAPPDLGSSVIAPPAYACMLMALRSPGALADVPLTNRPHKTLLASHARMSHSAQRHTRQCPVRAPGLDQAQPQTYASPDARRPHAQLHASTACMRVHMHVATRVAQPRGGGRHGLALT